MSFKFDNHIKNLMENREIQPSNNAWSKLNQKLEENQKPNRNKWFWLAGLAASFVGVLIMVNIFSTSVEKIPTLVESNKTKINSIKQIKIEPPKLEDFTEINKVAKTSEIKSKSTIREQIKKRTINTSTNIKEEALIENINDSQSDVALNEATLSEDFNSESITVQTQSTSDEIDELLSEALITATTPKTETIDASSLLYEVEIDVDRPFRAKVLAKIKENAMDLKTIFVNRNK